MIKTLVKGLLIEDSDTSAAQTLGVLQGAKRVDYHMTHVKDRAQALAFLNSQGARDTGLVILDLVLKNGEGQALVRDIRQAMPHEAALVVLTIRDEEETGIECLQAGADAFITKGSYSSSEEFLKAIRFFLVSKEIRMKGEKLVSPACATMERHEEKIREQELVLTSSTSAAVGQPTCPFWPGKKH